jgi:signal transduction histidine kinase
MQPPPVRAPRSAALPAGVAQRAADWRWRHWLVCQVLLAHVVALATFALLEDRTGALPLLALAAAALCGAWAGFGRAVRTLLAGGGLLLCSFVVVELAGGAGDASLHLVLVVALLALNLDWRLYAVAVVGVLLQRALVSPLDDVAAGSAAAWGWALAHALLVAAVCLVLVVVRRGGQQERLAQEQALRAELSAGRNSLQEQLAAADQMRADLIATVSHEFRTPLTGIRGSALTLLKRGDRLDKNGRDRLLHAVLDQQERLSRLLENMLVAAQATDVDPSATAEVDAVAAEVAMLAGAGRPGAQGVSVVVAPGLTARIDRQALHQVLANLVDNALLHGEPGQTPLVAGGEDERGVWITVSNEGGVIDLTARERLFEPFTQVNSGATRDREGIGVGLYVVRRLVEVYGGSVEVHSDSGWVTVQVRLSPAGGSARRRPGTRTAQTPVPTTLPTP